MLARDWPQLAPEDAAGIAKELRRAVPGKGLPSKVARYAAAAVAAVAPRDGGFDDVARAVRQFARAVQQVL